MYSPFFLGHREHKLCPPTFIYTDEFHYLDCVNVYSGNVGLCLSISLLKMLAGVGVGLAVEVHAHPPST